MTAVTDQVLRDVYAALVLTRKLEIPVEMKHHSFAQIVAAALMVILACGPSAPNPSSSQSASQQNASSTAATRDVRVGAFIVKVPVEWASFSSSEASTMRQQFEEQSKQIYQQYSGKVDPARTVELSAFHLAGDDGAFVIAALTVPPQPDLMNVLRSQAKDKADWGIQQGYIQKFLGLTSIDNQQFSGFYIRAIGKGGDFEVSGGLEHKNLKGTLVQLTLLCPKTWSQDKAESTLKSLLDSLSLAT